MKIDSLICQKIKDRDQQGLELLYDNYLNSLLGIAYGILKNISHSEDAVQKSILKIWNNIDKYDESKSTLFTWMVQIVKNTAIDIRRLKSFEKEEKSIMLDLHVHNKEVVEQNIGEIDANKILGMLDEKYAVVLKYLYLEGYSQSETAKALDIPLGTVKTRVKKGIDILRNSLKSEKGLFIGFLTIILIIIYFI